jgi:hypothetical protein
MLKSRRNDLIVPPERSSIEYSREAFRRPDLSLNRSGEGYGESMLGPPRPSDEEPIRMRRARDEDFRNLNLEHESAEHARPRYPLLQDRPGDCRDPGRTVVRGLRGNELP